jgi:hypothetical protein
MSENKLQMTPFQRRMKARRIRFFERWQKCEETREQLAERFNVSRIYSYVLTAELEAWETTATYQQQADDIRTIPKYREYKAWLWFLCSGPMILAYKSGEIPQSLFNKKLEHQTQDIIAVEQQSSLLI